MYLYCDTLTVGVTHSVIRTLYNIFVLVLFGIMTENAPMASSSRPIHNLTISPPQPFWPAGSEPCIKWLEWKNNFLNYLATIENDIGLSNEQKRIFLHSIGPSGLKVY